MGTGGTVDLFLNSGKVDLGQKLGKGKPEVFNEIAKMRAAM